VTPWIFRALELLERLNQAGVRYIVVGGLAVNAWGYVRGTKDLDIVPDPAEDNLRALAVLLEKLDGRVVAHEQVLAGSAIRIFIEAGDKTLVRTPIGEVDVLQGLPQVPRYSELLATAEEAEIQGVPVVVCSLEHLLAMKRAAGRAQDLIDIEALETAHDRREDE
jgi:predicted nucleotidyltransferase